MKHSLRKSFSYRRRKETHDEDHVYPRIDANGCSNSNSNLVKPVKSKSFLQRQRRSSSSSPPPPPPTSQSSDKIKSKVFEPRYDVHSNDDDDDDGDDPFSSSINTRTRPIDRLTYQIRKSFRNTLTRQLSRLESTNSNKRLLLNKKNDEKQTQIPILHPTITTGLTSPLTISVENDQSKPSVKRKKAPLAPKKMNQSISLPIQINPEKNLNRSLRTRFSFLRKKRPENHQQDENINTENPNKKLTLSQRFNSLRRSFRIGNRNSSNKVKRHLLSNE